MTEAQKLKVDDKGQKSKLDDDVSTETKNYLELTKANITKITCSKQLVLTNS